MTLNDHYYYYSKNKNWPIRTIQSLRKCFSIVSNVIEFTPGTDSNCTKYMFSPRNAFHTFVDVYKQHALSPNNNSNNNGNEWRLKQSSLMDSLQVLKSRRKFTCQCNCKICDNEEIVLATALVLCNIFRNFVFLFVRKMVR